MLCAPLLTDGNSREIVDVDKIDETDADALQKHAERYLDLAEKARTSAAVASMSGMFALSVW